MNRMPQSSTAVETSPNAAKKSNSPAVAASTTNVTKRLQSELMNLMTSSPPGISAFPNDTNMREWTATIVGPDETPFAGLTLKLAFVFPTTYPYQPPSVTFMTPIYHPNIDFSGRICLDILKDKWSAIYNVQSVLLSLQSLLGEPNNASPLNAKAAELWDNDPTEFKRQVLARHRDLDQEKMDMI